MLLAWSGGLDSTLALKYSLDFWNDRNKNWDWGQGQYEKKHGAPRTLVIECSQISAEQQLMQERCRKKFKKFIGEDFKEHRINVETNGQYRTDGLPQPLLWISQAALIIEPNEPLMIGWLKSDCDAYGNLPRIKEIWKQMCDVNGKDCPLWLPLIESKKIDIIRECRRNKIIDLCWWCESPIKTGKKIESCGSCGPCLTMLTAEVHNHKINASHSMKYDDYLEWLLDGEVDRSYENLDDIS